MLYLVLQAGGAQGVLAVALVLLFICGFAIGLGAATWTVQYSAVQCSHTHTMAKRMLSTTLTLSHACFLLLRVPPGHE